MIFADAFLKKKSTKMSKLAAAILLSTATGALAYSDQDTDVKAFLAEYPLGVNQWEEPTGCEWRDELNPATGSNGRVYCEPNTYIKYNKPLKDSTGVELSSALSVNLQGASLEGVSFSSDYDLTLRVSAIELKYANLKDAHFNYDTSFFLYANNANLQGATFSEVTARMFLREADLSGADFGHSAIYDNSDFTDVTLTDKTNIAGISFVDSDPSEYDLEPLYSALRDLSMSSSSSLADADCAELQSAYIGKMNAGQCQCTN